VGGGGGQEKKPEPRNLTMLLQTAFGRGRYKKNYFINVSPGYSNTWKRMADMATYKQIKFLQSIKYTQHGIQTNTKHYGTSEYWGWGWRHTQTRNRKKVTESMV
jgi:hypothetical protein